MTQANSTEKVDKEGLRKYFNELAAEKSLGDEFKWTGVTDVNSTDKLKMTD